MKEQINSIRVVVHFKNGDSIKGDQKTRQEMLHEMRQEASDSFDGAKADEMLDEVIDKTIETIMNLGVLTTMSITRNGNETGINPVNVNYIEIITS